jgi:hypothetical protein
MRRKPDATIFFYNFIYPHLHSILFMFYIYNALIILVLYFEGTFGCEI